MKTSRLLTLLLAACAGHGCRPPAGTEADASANASARVAEQSLMADTLFQSVHCGPDEAGVAVIADPADLSAATEAGSLPAIPPVEPAALPKGSTVLAVRMGPKPTGGFGLQLASGQVRASGERLIVPVRWHEPQADGIYTQALTSPCLVIAVHGTSFDTVEVIDQHGRVRLRGRR